jgi:hypothetical protein
MAEHLSTAEGAVRVYHDLVAPGEPSISTERTMGYR